MVHLNPHMIILEHPYWGVETPFERGHLHVKIIYIFFFFHPLFDV